MTIQLDDPSGVDLPQLRSGSTNVLHEPAEAVGGRRSGCVEPHSVEQTSSLALVVRFEIGNGMISRRKSSDRGYRRKRPRRIACSRRPNGNMSHAPVRLRHLSGRDLSAEVLLVALDLGLGPPAAVDLVEVGA